MQLTGTRATYGLAVVTQSGDHLPCGNPTELLGNGCRVVVECCNPASAVLCHAQKDICAAIGLAHPAHIMAPSAVTAYCQLRRLKACASWHPLQAVCRRSAVHFKDDCEQSQRPPSVSSLCRLHNGCYRLMRILLNLACRLYRGPRCVGQ